MVGGPLHN